MLFRLFHFKPSIVIIMYYYESPIANPDGIKFINVGRSENTDMS
jgi:hypothetical protein